ERLDEKAVHLVDRFRLHPPHQRYMHGLAEVVRQAVGRGNVVLVGRGCRHLVGNPPNVFHLRLVAPLEWRANRKAQLQGWTVDEARTRCTEADLARSRFMRYFFGEDATQPAQYDLVVNTARVPLPDVAAAVAGLARGEETAAADTPT